MTSISFSLFRSMHQLLCSIRLDIKSKVENLKSKILPLDLSTSQPVCPFANCFKFVFLSDPESSSQTCLGLEIHKEKKPTWCPVMRLIMFGPIPALIAVPLIASFNSLWCLSHFPYFPKNFDLPIQSWTDTHPRLSFVCKYLPSYPEGR